MYISTGAERPRNLIRATAHTTTPISRRSHFGSRPAWPNLNSDLCVESPVFIQFLSHVFVFMYICRYVYLYIFIFIHIYCMYV